jgi:hypothetical protein
MVRIGFNQGFFLWRIKKRVGESNKGIFELKKNFTISQEKKSPYLKKKKVKSHQI